MHAKLPSMQRVQLKTVRLQLIHIVSWQTMGLLRRHIIVKSCLWPSQKQQEPNSRTPSSARSWSRFLERQKKKKKKKKQQKTKKRTQTNKQTKQNKKKKKKNMAVKWLSKDFVNIYQLNYFALRYTISYHSLYLKGPVAPLRWHT